MMIPYFSIMLESMMMRQYLTSGGLFNETKRPWTRRITSKKAWKKRGKKSRK